MSSPSDGWASGSQSAADGTGNVQQVLLYWNGSSWSRIADLPGDGNITAIATLPGGYVWVATDSGIFQLISGTWVATYQNADAQGLDTINSLAMVSPTEGWAAGYISSGGAGISLLLHWHQGLWTPVATPPLPGTTILRGISMSADGLDGWAVGSIYTDAGEFPIALHYISGAWFEEDAGLPGPLTAVASLGTRGAWVVGIVSGVGPGYIAHWQDNAWQPVPNPTTNQLHAISMLSPAEGYIAGDGAATLHLSGGLWRREGVVIHGIALSGIAMTAPGEGWAVGGPVMLREHDGIWGIYTLHL
jgi:hypothetical protein